MSGPNNIYIYYWGIYIYIYLYNQYFGTPDSLNNKLRNVLETLNTK